jgi:hypothetical protein
MPAAIGVTMLTLHPSMCAYTLLHEVLNMRFLNYTSGLVLVVLGILSFLCIEFFYNNANALIGINTLRFFASLPMIASSGIFAILLVGKYYTKDNDGERQQYIICTLCLILLVIFLTSAAGRDWWRRELISDSRATVKGIIIDHYRSSGTPTNVYHFYVDSIKYEGRFSSYDFEEGDSIAIHYYPSNPLVNKPAFK